MQINRESLRIIRTRSGWSASKFAAACEISTGFLSNIEAGRRHASPEVIRRMAEVLDVPLQSLISNWDPEQVA